MSSKAFNITLPIALVNKVDRIARQNYTSRSDIIRQALIKEVKIDNAKQSEQHFESSTDKSINPRLKKMLDGVTPNNVHKELDWGLPVGREEW